jgi:outer membrane protein TolC
LADEALRIAQEQETVSNQLKNRSKKLLDAGAIAVNEYLSVESQWMADVQRSVVAANQYTLGLLVLKQFMGLPTSAELDLVRPNNLPNGPSAVLALLPEAVFQSSVLKQPLVRAAEHQLMASHYGLKRAQDLVHPRCRCRGRCLRAIPTVRANSVATTPRSSQLVFGSTG